MITKHNILKTAEAAGLTGLTAPTGAWCGRFAMLTVNVRGGSHPDPSGTRRRYRPMSSCPPQPTA